MRWIFSFIFLPLILMSQELRIEPPYWWAGMQLDTVQILFYEKDIAQYAVASSGGKILQTIKVENPNYLFVEFDFSDSTPGTFDILLEKPGAPPRKIPYTLLERKKGSADRKSFDAADVIYLLMPDRFANGNKKNDTAVEMLEKLDRAQQGGRHGGDIQGIIEHLDYIAALGATALWSTPLLEDNDPQGSYHTYAQSHSYRIDPRFGTHQDYVRLGEALHDRSMKLIMDYVTNHWGLEHWIIQDLPTSDWIHQFDEFTGTNHRKEIFSDPYASQIDYKTQVEGWFVPSMADVNLKAPLVLQYVKQNAIWWIESAGIDGFRVDTYPYNDPEAMVAWVSAIREEYPNFNIVGEGWMHDTVHVAYWQEDSAIGALRGYNSKLPSVMDFPLRDVLVQLFNENNSYWELGTTRLYKHFQKDFLYPNIHNVLIFTENHDTERSNAIYPDFKQYQQWMSVLMTIRGIPQIYYGTEIGMQGEKGRGDGDIRRDFPGGWSGDQNNAFTDSGRTETQRLYFNFTQKLLQWRKNKAVIHFGKMLHYVPENDVYVYFRYDETECVMVVVNNNLESQTLHTSRFEEGLNQLKRGFEIITEQEFLLEKELTIPGQTVYIIELF